MLTLHEIDRLIKMIDEYCYIINYAISKYAVWVDMYSGENDVHLLRIIRDKLENEVNNRLKYAGALKDSTHE